MKLLSDYLSDKSFDKSNGLFKVLSKYLDAEIDDIGAHMYSARVNKQNCDGQEKVNGRWLYFLIVETYKIYSKTEAEVPYKNLQYTISVDIDPEFNNVKQNEYLVQVKNNLTKKSVTMSGNNLVDLVSQCMVRSLVDGNVG